MPKFKTITELITYARNSLYKMVESDTGLIIQDFLKEEISRSVEKNVYDVYEPESYERRKNSGGLSDMDNIEITGVELTANGIKITAENLTKGAWETGEEISHLIEFGAYGNRSNAFWDDPTGEWADPRPFMHILTQQLKDNPRELIDVVHMSLVSSGFKVRSKT